MNHTPEPWSIDGQTYIWAESIKDYVAITNSDPECSRIGYDEHCENARRIVACVNACAGVPNEFLEKIAKKEMDGSEFFELGKITAQRENLQKTNENLKTYISLWDKTDEYVRKHPSVKLGQSVNDAALRLLTERDSLESQRDELLSELEKVKKERDDYRHRLSWANSLDRHGA